MTDATEVQLLARITALEDETDDLRRLLQLFEVRMSGLTSVQLRYLPQFTPIKLSAPFRSTETYA